MQLQFLFQPARRPAHEGLRVGAALVPLVFVRNARARRYVLRVREDGSARITIPRGGSLAAAREFAQRHQGWIEKELRRRAAPPLQPRVWTHGSLIFYRGNRVRLELMPGRGEMRFGDQCIPVTTPGANLRPSVEAHLWRMAIGELEARTFELAALHQVTVRRVVVRNQRSRWGSCSATGTVSLNWRLVQAPEFVRDYIILHELMHLREMNHSRRFWRHVAAVCPDYERAEAWLNQHAALLR